MKNLSHHLIAAIAALTSFAVTDAMISDSKAQDACMIGEVRMFGGTFAPVNWAFANGQLLAVSQYDALFSVIGNLYGGDGRTTFGLPDLRGRAAVGAGTGPGLSPRNLGQLFGAQTTAITAANMPSHTHAAQTNVTMNASTGAATTTDPTSSTLANDSGGSVYSTQTPDVSLASGAASATTTLESTGGGQSSFNNYQPSAGTNYIICLIGIYPSRN